MEGGGRHACRLYFWGIGEGAPEKRTIERSGDERIKFLTWEQRGAGGKGEKARVSSSRMTSSEDGGMEGDEAGGGASVYWRSSVEKNLRLSYGILKKTRWEIPSEGSGEKVEGKNTREADLRRERRSSRALP